MDRNSKASTELPLLFAIIAGGLLLRLIYFGQLHGGLDVPVFVGEGTLVAHALAEGRGFSDAYVVGYGPTAHLLPIFPALTGLLLWLSGPGSGTANLVLLGWALLQVGFAYYLLSQLFSRLGADPLAIKIATAFLCLVPVFAEQETVDFRYWEGAWALCFVAANLLFLLKLEARERLGDRSLLAIAVLASITFCVSPPAGVATGVCWIVFALRRLCLRQIVKLIAFGSVVLASMVIPWTIRNATEVGAPVWLRSNAGLELAIGNHPEALSARPRREVFNERMLAIHPIRSEQARHALRKAGGEVAYSAKLGAETRKWIVANPMSFAKLSLRHLGQFYFPEPWQMEFSTWGAFRSERARVIALANLAGLIALGAGLWRRRRGYGYLALYVSVVALPYMVVQPSPRYSYLVFGLLAFVAMEGLVRGVRKLVERAQWRSLAPSAATSV